MQLGPLSSLRGRCVVLTGPTGQVGRAVVRRLAGEAEIIAVARFRDSAAREQLEAAGVRCVAADLAEADLSALPEDPDAVLHFAVSKHPQADFAADLRANAEGLGRLLSRCRRAKAALVCSSAAVYAYAGGKPVSEDAPLGDNHRSLLPTYSLSKIAAETVARFAAREFSVPVVIARLSVPYGDEGGWPWYHLLMMQAGHAVPVHPERPDTYNLLHEDDLVAHIPLLLAAASVPASTFNWGGEVVGIETWCGELGRITGLEPRFEESERAIGALPLDTSRLQALGARIRVPWREGLRRMVAARNPELLRGEAAREVSAGARPRGADCRDDPG